MTSQLALGRVFKYSQTQTQLMTFFFFFGYCSTSPGISNQWAVHKGLFSVTINEDLILAAALTQGDSVSSVQIRRCHRVGAFYLQFLFVAHFLTWKSRLLLSED